VSPVWNDLGGLMMRSSTDTSAAFASVSALDARGVFWQWRSSNNGSSAYQLVTELPMPMWLRLTRTNNLVKSFYSQDGQNWTLYYSRSINLGSNPIAGLVTVKNGARSRFDKLSLSSMGSVTDNQAGIKANGARIFPNPGNENSWLEFEAESTDKIQFQIRDGLGRILKDQFIACTRGRNLLPIQNPELESGMYYIQLSGQGINQQIRWVVQ
jgi:hypothetical protein